MAILNIASRFDEIYDSTRKQVLAYITSKCSRTADINDIFQDTYMELYRILDKRGVDHVRSDKAYVMMIAKRKIARHYSLLNRIQSFVFVPGKNDEEDKDVLSDFEPDSFLLEDFVVDQTMVDLAWDYLRKKPQDVRKVFYLYFDVGLTIPEIAESLILTQSSVKNKLYRTLKELRNELK